MPHRFASLEFVNDDLVRMNAIDDFAFIVPEPGSVASAGAAIATLFYLGANRRRQRRFARP